jgi:SEC-C motif
VPHGNNVRCWCGSQKKLKHCHKQPYRRPASRGEVVHKLRIDSAQRTCLHPDASAACGKIIAAHTIQRSRVLDAIAGPDNHVLSFDVTKGRGRNELGVARVGCREASTFTGFCSAHDAELFSPLEVVPFSGSPEQCFLHAYRAVCRELHAKSSALKGLSKVSTHLPPNEPKSLEMMQRLADGNTAGFADLRVAKDRLDDILKQKTFSEVDYAVFEFDAPLHVAACGAYPVEYTLDGHLLQELGDRIEPAEYVAISTDVTTHGAACVVCWPRSFALSKRYVESILALCVARRMQVLPQLLFMHLENTYFSEAWWSSLVPDTQAALTRLSNMLGPDYRAHILERRPTTRWRERRVSTSWPS